MGSARGLWTTLVRTQEKWKRKVGYLERSERYCPDMGQTQALNDSESLGKQVIVGAKDRNSCQLTRAGSLVDPLVK